MSKFLVVGDLHLRNNRPKSRIDDFYETQKNKLMEINTLAEKNNCKKIVCTGDILDKPLVSITDLFAINELLKEIKLPIYTCLGNHDIFGYNTETYNRSSLRILEAINENLIVVATKVNEFECDALAFGDHNIFFISFNKEQDDDPENYFIKKADETPVIGVFHGMLTTESYPFKHTMLYDVETEADLTICGHDHLGFGLVEHKGKKFLNPGSLTRQSASMKEIERMPQVAIVTVENNEVNVDLIQLRCAEPGENVLDRSELDERNEKIQLMQEFSAIIKSENSGLDRKLNVFEVIETISQLEKIDENIKNAAVKLVEKAIEKLQHTKEK